MNYTIGQVKKLTGLHQDTIRNYAKKGKIDSFRDPLNNYWMITEKGLLQLKQAKKLPH